MDTLTFLKTIMPSTGLVFAQRIRPRPGKKDATILYPVGDLDDLAGKLLELDAQHPNENIYYAMASYKEVQYKTVKSPDGREFEFATGRTQDNVAAVKSLWFDLDVGKLDETGNVKADCYATQKEAYAAVVNYCEKTSMPVPIVVTSGYGLHCYWPFTESVSPQEWKSIVKIQRAAWQHLGMKVDSACDMDCARVLRAPGTHNKKSGKEPKVVRVLKGDLNPMPPMEYKRRLRGYVDTNNLTVQVKDDTPEWAKVSFGNLDGALPVYPDSYASIAVEHCKQIQDFRATGGSSEPVWYANIGLFKHFKDGTEFAHKWGSIHNDYVEAETDQKLDQWQVGPTTCERFKSINAAGCEGCKRTCTSPVQLGLDEKIEAPNLIEIAEETIVASETSILSAAVDSGFSPDGIPTGWPSSFGFDKANNRVTMKVKDPDGVWQQIAIAEPLFYPVEQVRAEDGTYFFKMHMWVRGKVREFELPTKFTADIRSLKMHLHANQARVIDDKATAAFMSQFMSEMRNVQEETETYRQMGWKHNNKAWLIGDTLITETGTRKATLSQAFSQDRRALYNPKGNPMRWVEAVDTLYNREHGEPYQFAICAAFAAPLHELLGYSEWRGIPFALTTNESGFGKTTVNMIANSIWYDPEKAKVSNATAKAVLGIASEFNNLPFLLDEVTSYLKDPADMGDLLYSLSNGRGREGMKQGGGLRENTQNWIGTCCMTGNRNILMQVSENQLNPEAMQMRVFEIDLDVYPRIATMSKGTADFAKYNAEHQLITQTLTSDCSGVIGTEYIRYVMRNVDNIKTNLRKVSTSMSRRMSGGDATKERFYYHLITTVLVGGAIAKKLGFINFNMDNLKKWCVAHVAKLRNHSKEFRCTPQDHFAAMMSDFMGRIIITKNFDSLDARRHKTELHQGGQLRSGVCGRYVLGDDKERTQLYITASAVQQWCVEQGIPYTTLRRDFVREGIIRIGRKDTNSNTGASRIKIGKGVPNISELGTPWCFEMDAERASGIIPMAPAADVVELKTGT